MGRTPLKHVETIKTKVEAIVMARLCPKTAIYPW